MLRDIEPRLYQEKIFHECVLKNCLVVLPTGMGKTLIAAMLATHRLMSYPQSKILMLAPTRPLAQQHIDTFKRHLEVSEITLLTGMVEAEKRQLLWRDAKIVIATPQGVENDLISGRISLEDVSLLIFDEAHRAVKDYSYVWIAEQYYKKAKYPRILAMTASPGSDIESINEVCKNLFIEGVEVRTDDDPDVRPYIQEVDVSWHHVELPPSFREVQTYIKVCIAGKIKELREVGIQDIRITDEMSRKDLLMLQGQLQAEMAQGKSFESMRGLSILAEIMKLQHALELIETQGMTSLAAYMGKIMTDSQTSKVKAVQNLVRDANFKAALLKARENSAAGIQHPKLEALKRIVQEDLKKGMKLLVFSQYRDSAKKIEEELNLIPGVRASIFVGQMKKGTTGMSQKEQLAMLERFRAGELDVLISTSVGEEGLDIPQVDMVIFYEPVPSAIRAIQRRGRTGRTEKGKVVVLTTRDTRDEAYKWSAFHKERRMISILRDLKRRIVAPIPTMTLTEFLPETKVRIIADHREKGSHCVKELLNLNTEIELKQLESADFILSDRVAVEIKRVPDFVDSIIDGRLLEQLKILKQSYERPLLIVEGTEDIFSQRNIHPNAIRGMIATIAVSYGIALVATKSSQDTAALLHIIARREQESEPRDFSPHAQKPSKTLREQQEYIISALPGIGMAIAKPLLERFGSVRNIVNATEEELKAVEGVGEKKAKAIREVLDREYGQ